MPAELPSFKIPLIRDAAARLIDSRRKGTNLEVLARDLYAVFVDVCSRGGLDNVLAEIEQDPEVVVPTLAAKLETIDLDGGSPRNLKPGQLADCVIAALGLTVVEAPAASFSLADTVRLAVIDGFAAALDVELAVPKIRDTIIADARRRCDESAIVVFPKVVKELDERGSRLIRQPKVGLDAVAHVQRALGEARDALIARVGGVALDRAKAAISAADAAAGAKIDEPVTLLATPREIAIARAQDARTEKSAVGVSHALFEALTELVRIEWLAPEVAAQTYAASKKYAVGDVIDHPKFGRGSVTAALVTRVEVEFEDGMHTLVHARG